MGNSATETRGNPPPPRKEPIGVLVTGSEKRRELRAALELMALPHFVGSGAELLELLSEGDVGTVIVEPGADGRRPTEALVRELRSAFSSLLILAYCDLSPDHVRQIPPLVHAGVDGLILRGIDDIGPVIQNSIERSVADRVASEALEELRPFVAEQGEPVLTYCLTHANRQSSVAQMANELGVHRKTLFYRTLVAGLPPPGALIAWCRLLYAARLLEDAGRSVERTAHALGFASATALRNAMRRYTGLRPSELAARGGQRVVMELLKDELKDARRNGAGRHAGGSIAADNGPASGRAH